MKRRSLPASTPASNTLPASSVRPSQSVSRLPPWRQSRCVCGNTIRPGPLTAKSCSMPVPHTYSFARYLTAKKSVDDRALNQSVWQSLLTALPRAIPEQPLQILEVGAGLGTMVERLVASEKLTHATYTAIDLEPALIAEARRRLPQWATAQGWQVQHDSQTQVRPGGPEFHMQRSGQDIRIATEAIDLFHFIAREQGRRTWDLLIAQALLDLVDVPTTLPALLSLLRPGGLLYCPITFDGGTVFQPEIDREFDAAIEACYHQTMDQRLVAGKPSGDSRTGRHLFAHLRAAGAEVLAAGSSDWVVFAGPNGYAADEAYFLHFIIHTMHTALAGHPDLDAERFTAWIAQRHAQVEQSTLVSIAHQLDVLGRVPAPPGETGECTSARAKLATTLQAKLGIEVAAEVVAGEKPSGNQHRPPGFWSFACLCRRHAVCFLLRVQSQRHG